MFTLYNNLVELAEFLLPFIVVVVCLKIFGDRGKNVRRFFPDRLVFLSNILLLYSTLIIYAIYGGIKLGQAKFLSEKVSYDLLLIIALVISFVNLFCLAIEDILSEQESKRKRY